MAWAWNCANHDGIEHWMTWAWDWPDHDDAEMRCVILAVNKVDTMDLGHLNFFGLADWLSVVWSFGWRSLIMRFGQTSYALDMGCPICGFIDFSWLRLISSQDAYSSNCRELNQHMICQGHNSNFVKCRAADDGVIWRRTIDKNKIHRLNVLAWTRSKLYL